MASQVTPLRQRDLSQYEKFLSDMQSDMIRNFVMYNFDVDIKEISRDKHNHILLLGYDENNWLKCYMLGVNTKTNALDLYVVGIADPKDLGHETYIGKLAVHKAFMRERIGTTMHQFIENETIINHFKKISVSSMQSFVDLNSPSLSAHDAIKQFGYSDGISYIKDFRDINFIFYSSLGYELSEDDLDPK